MPVHFFIQQVKHKWGNQPKLRSWINKVVTSHHFKLQSLNIILCNDDYLLELNKKFLKHNTFTDIITFTYAEEKKVINGEIYISLDRVKENAEKYESSPKQELRRVIIHGVLHLLGYKDKTVLDKKRMRLKEDESLNLF